MLVSCKRMKTLDQPLFTCCYSFQKRATPQTGWSIYFIINICLNIWLSLHLELSLIFNLVWQMIIVSQCLEVSAKLALSNDLVLSKSIQKFNFQLWLDLNIFPRFWSFLLQTVSTYKKKQFGEVEFVCIFSLLFYFILYLWHILFVLCSIKPNMRIRGCIV